MKVLGQLEQAQLEQLAADPATNTPTGRIYMNVSNPLAAVPKVFNGTAWVPFSVGQGGAFVTQNSGLACTVNWATGLNQRVVLTNNCLISFSNPQAGQVHTLEVVQASYTLGNTKNLWVYKLNMIDQDSRRMPYQPVGALPVSSTQIWAWFYSPGAKPGFATIPDITISPNASYTLPATTVNSWEISPDGNTLTACHTTTPFMGQFQINWNSYSPSFGQFYATGAWAGGAAAKNMPDMSALIATAYTTTPFIQARYLGQGYTSGPTTPGTVGVSTAGFANPATLPASAYGLDIHPTGMAIALGQSTSPFVNLYSWSSAVGFGVKAANPIGTAPTATPQNMVFSPMGDFLAVGFSASPYLMVCPVTVTPTVGTVAGTVQFGTFLTNPATLPLAGSSGPHGLAWRPQGDFIALVQQASPYIYIVPFNRTLGAFGVPLTIPTLAAITNPTSIQWTPDGQYLVIGQNASPYFSVIDFSTQTVTAVVTFDGNGPGSGSMACVDSLVHPSGDWAICGAQSAPFVKLQALPTKVRNYIRLTE